MRRSASSLGHQHPRLSTRTISTRATLSTALVLLGLVCFLFSAVFHVTSVPGRARRTSSTTAALLTELLNRYLKLVARRERHSQASAWDLDLSYVSKRRVPNGPDPIHNRKSVKYRQPPGA